MVEAVFPGTTYDEEYAQIQYYNKNCRIVFCEPSIGNMIPMRSNKKKGIVRVPKLRVTLNMEDITELLERKDDFLILEDDKDHSYRRAMVEFVDVGWKYVMIQEHFEKQKPAKKKGALT